jgi:ribosomal protein S26
MRYGKASISGREVSCDICGRIVPREQVISVYFGPYGEKVDFCRKCLR